jgi:hypothetical protein
MNKCTTFKDDHMDDRVYSIAIMVAAITGLVAGYGLGGWMEYRKGFETGIKTSLSIMNSVTVTPKDGE